jgi:hypothetical protein
MRNKTSRPWNTEDWQLALERLRKKRDDIQEQIKVVLQELDKAKRNKNDASRTKVATRRHNIAHLVLIQGMKISEAAIKTNTHSNYARLLLHQHCWRANRKLYYTCCAAAISGFSLIQLRKHASEFFPEINKDETPRPTPRSLEVCALAGVEDWQSKQPRNSPSLKD